MAQAATCLVTKSLCGVFYYIIQGWCHLACAPVTGIFAWCHRLHPLFVAALSANAVSSNLRLRGSCVDWVLCSDSWFWRWHNRLFSWLLGRSCAALFFERCSWRSARQKVCVRLFKWKRRFCVIEPTWPLYRETALFSGKVQYVPDAWLVGPNIVTFREVRWHLSCSYSIVNCSMTFIVNDPALF